MARTAIFLLLVSRGRTSVLAVLAALALVGVGIRYLAWSRFTYSLEGGALVTESGILNRTRKVVPVDRIQQVDLQRKLRHQLFGLAVVRVDTAGTGPDRRDHPRCRQQRRGRAAAGPALGSPGGGPGRGPGRRRCPGLGGPCPGADARSRRPLRNERWWPSAPGAWCSAASPGRSWRPCSPPASPSSGCWATSPPGCDARPPTRCPTAPSPACSPCWCSLLLALPVVLVLAAGTAVLTDGGFRLTRRGDDLHVRRGLLDQREATLPVHRVQVVRVHDNPLRRMLGLVSVTLQSAGGSGQVEKQDSRITIPVLAVAELDRLLAETLPGSPPLPPLKPAPGAARRRAWLRRVVPAARPGGGLGAAVGAGRALVALALVPLAALGGELAYRGLGLGDGRGARGGPAGRSGARDRGGAGGQGAEHPPGVLAAPAPLAPGHAARRRRRSGPHPVDHRRRRPTTWSPCGTGRPAPRPPSDDERAVRRRTAMGIAAEVHAVSPAERRRSWWGWGWEDEAASPPSAMPWAAPWPASASPPTTTTRRRPRRISRSEPPRITAPTALAAICADDPETRAAHTYGKAYRDVVRGLRGRSRRPARRRGPPRDRGRRRRPPRLVRRRAASRPSPTAAALGGRRRRGPRSATATPARCRSTSRAWTGCSRSTPRRRAARIQAGALGPALEDQLRPARLDAAPLPAVLRVLDPRRLDRHPRRAATSPPLYTHIDDLVESLRVVTPVRRQRVPPPAGLRRRAVARPPLARLGGALGDHHRGVGAAPGPAPLAARRPRCASPTWARGRRRGAGACRSPGLHARRTAACSTAAEARCLGVPATAAPLLVLGFESADHPVGAWIARAVELCRDHGGEVPDGVRPPTARPRRGAPRPAARARRGAWRSTPSSGRPTSATRWSALGLIVETFETACTWDALRRAPRRGDRGRRPSGDRRRAAPGIVTCRFTHVYPDGPAPYFTVYAQGRWGDQVAQWDEIEGGRLRGPRSPPAAPSPTTTPSAATTGPGTTASARSPSPAPSRAAKARPRPRRHPQPRRPPRPTPLTPPGALPALAGSAPACGVLPSNVRGAPPNVGRAAGCGALPSEVRGAVGRREHGGRGSARLRGCPPTARPSPPSPHPEVPSRSPPRWSTASR